jgi:hypothetical protein
VPTDECAQREDQGRRFGGWTAARIIRRIDLAQRIGSSE